MERLLDFYLAEQRPEAARNLLSDLTLARKQIAGNPHGGASHPRPYPALSTLAFRWIKVRRYWVSWAVVSGEAIITNILYESADMERRAADDTRPAED